MCSNSRTKGNKVYISMFYENSDTLYNCFREECEQCITIRYPDTYVPVKAAHQTIGSCLDTSFECR